MELWVFNPLLDCLPELPWLGCRLDYAKDLPKSFDSKEHRKLVVHESVCSVCVCVCMCMPVFHCPFP